ncbi:MAG: hypothetical protein NC131_08040 [Roseburia sp.]|nr:hypothetical protein [Roseburia sp.]
MKGKALLAALAAACLMGGAAAVAGCSNGSGGHTHDYTGVEFTPNSDGKTHSKKCTVDGCNVVTETDTHNFGKGVPETPATCRTEGVTKFTCTDCGYSYTEPAAKTAHSWGEWTVAEGCEPDGETSGTATRKCTVEGCGAVDQPLTVPNLTEGEFTTVVKKAKSCTEDGITEYTYTHGGDTVKFDVTVPKSHDYQAEITWASGFPERAEITCSACDDVHDEIVRQYVPENEGDTQNGSITETYEYRIANCQQSGYSRRTAKVEYKGQIIKTELKVLSETPITDHDYETSTGKLKYGFDETKHWHVCVTKDCGHKDETSEAEHDFENNVLSNVIIKYATATEQGEREIECACGYKKVFKFDGQTDNCDMLAPYYSVTDFQGAETSQTPLGETGGKYYYQGGNESVLFGFSNLSNGALAVHNVELFYEMGGTYVPVIAVTERKDGDEHPVAGGFIKDAASANGGKCAIRFYKVGGELKKIDDGDDNYHFVYEGGSYAQVNLKVVVYVGEESVAVEKTLTFAPVPVLEKPQAYTYIEYVAEGSGKEPYFNYDLTDLSDITMYVGQSYKFIARGYTVTVSKEGGEAETLTEEGNEFTFTPETAGEYLISVANPYNAKESYAVTLTVNAAADTAKLFAGKYAAGDYTVTFGEENAVTVQKGEEPAVNLTYAYQEGVFATSGSSTISLILTPAYKLYVADSGAYYELQAKGEATDEIYGILGGTSWEKEICTIDASMFITRITVTISFNTDKTGVITIKLVMTMSANGMTMQNQQSTFKFTYGAEIIDGKYKLKFTLTEDDYSANAKAAYEFGIETDDDLPEGKTYTDYNDFSIMNKNSIVTVDNEEVSLSLWLRTGDTNSSNATEQAVEFEKVTA